MRARNPRINVILVIGGSLGTCWTRFIAHVVWHVTPRVSGAHVFAPDLHTYTARSPRGPLGTMSASPEHALGDMLGLDSTTVSEQIMPYLSSYKSPKALRTYLHELIGTSMQANAITDALVASRFPQNTMPRKEDTKKPIRLTPASVKSALAEAEERAQTRALEPTPEIKALDTAFSMLSTEPSSPAASVYAPKKRYMCLCQGRAHALAEWVPLCFACGLILCSAIRPVPVSPYSACPSCQTSPIVSSKNRTRLLSDMVNLREELSQEQADQEAQRQAERNALRASGRTPEQAFPTLQGTPAPPPTAQPKQRSRTLHLDMKTHKVTVSKSRSRPVVPTKSKQDSDDGVPTVAEDGSLLVHDVDDDMFRSRMSSTAPSVLPAYQRWQDIPTSVTCVYVPASSRDARLEAFESHELTQVPDLDVLLQRRPPGSAASTQRRNRKNATDAAISRSQGRKTGKPGRRRRPGS